MIIAYLALVPFAVSAGWRVTSWAMDPAGPLARYADRVAERRAAVAAIEPAEDFPALEVAE